MRENVRDREYYAENLLDKYRRAKAVITIRLHAAMPCLSFKTPVMVIHPIDLHSDARFQGLKSLVKHSTYSDFSNGLSEFDLNNPPENSQDYLVLRESLINTVTDWINQNSNN